MKTCKCMEEFEQQMRDDTGDHLGYIDSLSIDIIFIYHKPKSNGTREKKSLNMRSYPVTVLSAVADMKGKNESA